jgi:hypothetical protein
MEKTIVSLDYLLSWMNSQIANYDSCDNCRFTTIIVTEPDENGSNWSDAELRCSGVPTDICRPIALQVIAAARKNYNVG